ncbi:MAG: DUF3019 domain-containing protein [Povalibacter sp.]
MHAANDSELPQDLELRLQPRVCTLSATEDACNTTVKAQWRAAQDESLCLVIVDRPDIKKCWEHFTEGTYSIELVFDKDLIVQLRDPDLQHVLASQTITVIKEALQLRRKRRQPWNLLY